MTEVNRYDLPDDGNYFTLSIDLQERIMVVKEFHDYKKIVETRFPLEESERAINFYKIETTKMALHWMSKHPEEVLEAYVNRKL